MSENAEIAERLRQALAVRGMSQADLERASKLSKPHISRLLNAERGKAMRKETRERLARALDVPVAWLFAGVGDPPFGEAIPHSSAPVARAETTDAMIAARIADSVERYPSKAGAAAALRAMGVSEGAIDAMLTEEHSGSDGDPGRKRLASCQAARQRSVG